MSKVSPQFEAGDVENAAPHRSCLQRGRDYSTVCPQKWVDDWKQQASEGRNLTVGTTFL